jgi:hypothetical protein
VIFMDCDFIMPHTHELPDDYYLTGPSGTDMRADPRYVAAVYEYYNERVQIIHTTVVPQCDMEALDYCTLVASWGPGFSPVWVSVKRSGEKIEMLPWVYDKSTDEVEPK